MEFKRTSPSSRILHFKATNLTLTEIKNGTFSGKNREFSTSAMSEPGNGSVTIAISMSFVTFLTTGASFFDTMGRSYVAASVSEKGKKNSCFYPL